MFSNTGSGSCIIHNKLQWNSTQNVNIDIFSKKNACQNVTCEISAILSRPQMVMLMYAKILYVARVHWVFQAGGSSLKVIQFSRPTDCWYLAMLTIRTICHARDLWKFARSCRQLCLLCPPYPWNLPGGIALLSGFRSSQADLKSTE